MRETEAWTLVDGDALRAFFGIKMTNQQLGIPSKAREVEKLIDPKQVLELALAKAVGSRRGKMKAAAFLEILSEKIELACLREVPAFNRFENELKNALASLGILGTTKCALTGKKNGSRYGAGCKPMPLS